LRGTKGVNTCIWKLENELENIIQLLEKNYSKPIPQLANLNIPTNEKILVYKWEKADERGYEQRTLLVGDKEIKYIKAIAHIESHALPLRNIIMRNGNPLPKEIRVNENNSTVYFVNNSEGSVYVIICGSKSLEGKIRSTLMESRTQMSEWKKIYNNPTNYKFEKGFYYWILENKNNTLEDGGKKIELMDVRGFKSNSDRTAHSYRGEGSNIGEEIPLKSIVSMDESLVSLYIKILYNETITYSFYLDNDGRLSIFNSECGEFATEEPKILEIEEIFLKVYFDIIPFLIQQYNKALSNGWKDKELDFRKQLSIDVIMELMQENNVEILDLQSAINI